MRNPNLPQKTELEILEDKTILVAGAAGFIPSHICEFYLEKGAKVIGLDNFITGSHDNIEYLCRYKHFDFHEANIYESLPSLSREKIDFIFSMASPASPIDFERLPLEIMRVNSEGTRQLLEVARQHNARFLEASTSEVYGDPEVHPQTESYNGCVNPIGPRSCYVQSKRYAEALTMTYHRYYGLDTRIIRIFNTYGPRMRPNDGRVIPNFINQALKGQALTVHGDGSQTRSFCYISDLVQGLHRVMFSDETTPFNCGNPDEHTILDLAKLIVSTLQSDSTIAFTGLPEDDPRRRCPDIQKLQDISDYQPHVSLQEGIQMTASYFKQIAEKS